jgi:cysteine sulfinate desulfinase/cysteine desulfurase-like protein
MGVPATPSFRVGTGRSTTLEDVDRLLEALPQLVDDLRLVETQTEAAMAQFRPTGSSD